SRGTGRARHHLVRYSARRTVPLERPWPELGDDPFTLGRSQAQEMGGGGRGGADLPGIHSICVDPRNAKQVSIGVSTGGIWHTADGGASWTLRGEGMRAEYMPPEQAHDPISQDVHCLAQCRAAPQRMWVQHHN